MPEEEAFECNNSEIAMETSPVVSSEMLVRCSWEKSLESPGGCILCAVPRALAFLSFEGKVTVEV